MFWLLVRHRPQRWQPFISRAEKFPVARAFLGRAERLHGRHERSIWQFEVAAKLQREMNAKIRAAGVTPHEEDSVAKLVREMYARNDAICDELKAVTKEIEDTIRAATDDNTTAVLEERYLGFHSIEEIISPTKYPCEIHQQHNRIPYPLLNIRLD